MCFNKTHRNVPWCDEIQISGDIFCDNDMSRHTRPLQPGEERAHPTIPPPPKAGEPPLGAPCPTCKPGLEEEYTAPTRSPVQYTTRFDWQVQPFIPSPPGPTIPSPPGPTIPSPPGPIIPSLPGPTIPLPVPAAYSTSHTMGQPNFDLAVDSGRQNHWAAAFGDRSVWDPNTPPTEYLAPTPAGSGPNATPGAQAPIGSMRFRSNAETATRAESASRR